MMKPADAYKMIVVLALCCSAIGLSYHVFLGMIDLASAGQHRLAAYVLVALVAAMLWMSWTAYRLGTSSKLTGLTRDARHVARALALMPLASGMLLVANVATQQGWVPIFINSCNLLCCTLVVLATWFVSVRYADLALQGVQPVVVKK